MNPLGISYPIPIGDNGFQLFRFEVIGEPLLYVRRQNRHRAGFQLFRFEVIGELSEADARSLVNSGTFPTIPI